MNERLRKIRIEQKMSQEEFGKWLGISKSGVSEIESGRRNVTEQHIIMLKNHGVNEHWLRTGEGEMFLTVDPEDALMEKVGRMLADKPESFRRRLVSALMDLSDEDLEYLKRFCEKLVEEEQNKKKS